jgi:hypothetical protein
MDSSRTPAGPDGVGGPQRRGTGWWVVTTVGGYVARFFVGAVQGLIGTFHYSLGPGPLVAVLFDLAILATCVLGSSGMRTALGGVLPAAGWFAVALPLTSTSAGGSVIVTNTTAGEWFLFGGALCAAAGTVYSFARWSRPSRERRSARSDTGHGRGSWPATRGR